MDEGGDGTADEPGCPEPDGEQPSRSLNDDPAKSNFDSQHEVFDQAQRAAIDPYHQVFDQIQRAAIDPYHQVFDQIQRAAIDPYHQVFDQIQRAAIDPYHQVFDQIQRAAIDPYHQVFDQIQRAAIDPYHQVFDQIQRMIPSNYGALVADLNAAASNYSMSMLLVTARSVAREFVNEAVDEETRAQDWWRDAANQWVNEHALALMWWMVGGVVLIMFCMAELTAPELVDGVNQAVATPLALAGIVLAVWANRKPKG